MKPQIDLYIDNNVWDFLFSRKLDLSVELPSSEFSLHLTKEAEFEIAPMPEEKRSFVEGTIKKCGIDVRPYGGFYDERHTETEQRYGGFDVGFWADEKECEFIKMHQPKLGSTKKKTGLFKNEADISLAARSFHSIVITLDKKPGALLNAYQKGWKVVFLNDFDEACVSLKEFILSEFHKMEAPAAASGNKDSDH